MSADGANSSSITRRGRVIFDPKATSPSKGSGGFAAPGRALTAGYGVGRCPSPHIGEAVTGIAITLLSWQPQS
jgi:hypothetical protein